MGHVANVSQAAASGNRVFQTGATSSSWLGRNLKAIGSSAWDCAKKIGSFVAQIFSKIGHFFKDAFLATKNAAVRGWDASRLFLRNHPREVRGVAIGLGVAVAIALVVAIVVRCRRSEQPPATPIVINAVPVYTAEPAPSGVAGSPSMPVLVEVPPSDA